MIRGYTQEDLATAARVAFDPQRTPEFIAKSIELFDRGLQAWPALEMLCCAYDDPAKLAAIIAELLRERGIDAGSGEDVAPIRVESCFGRIEFIESPEKLPLILKMDQCRRLALTLLETPNATAQDIERMIGEL